MIVGVTPCTTMACLTIERSVSIVTRKHVCDVPDRMNPRYWYLSYLSMTYTAYTVEIKK